MKYKISHKLLKLRYLWCCLPGQATNEHLAGVIGNFLTVTRDLGTKKVYKAYSNATNMKTDSDLPSAVADLKDLNAHQQLLSQGVTVILQ